LQRNLESVLSSDFGFDSFRPGQRDAIERILQGEHTLVVMPTGAGKSLIYQFCAVNLPGVTLVISPLISLMHDQVQTLNRRRISSTFINSAVPTETQNERLKAMTQGKYRLVYIAPERLSSTVFVQGLRRANVSLLAVDEAHCISQWGHDFRPDYLRIAAARAMMGAPTTTALTATATPQVRSDIATHLQLDRVRHIVTGFNRPNLTFEVRYAADPEAKLREILQLVRSVVHGAAIIYAGTRRDAEEVSEFIESAAGIEAPYYHAGLCHDERARVQDRFMSGDLNAVVATNAFGMGIDRSDVRLVAHYAVPGSLEAYYQEAGRAGRDGKASRAVLIYSPRDRALQEHFINDALIPADSLKRLHDAVACGSPDDRLTSDELSRATGMREVEVRVGLSLLEEASAVWLGGTDGHGMEVAALQWNGSEIARITGLARVRAQQRFDQLGRIVGYAESDACRRKTILDHFGDPDDTVASTCCDNCIAASRHASSASSSDGASLTPENETALLILDAVRSMRWEVGRGKLSSILKGSRSKEIARFDYDKNPRYGKLAVFSVGEIEGLVDQMLGMGYLKLTGALRPVLKLTSLGLAALERREAISLLFPREVSSRSNQVARKRRSAGVGSSDTAEITARLFADGLSVPTIASERGLAIGTIYGHLAQMIQYQRVDLSKVVPEDRVAVIRDGIRKAGDDYGIGAIKRYLPDDIDYGEIRCVLAAGNSTSAAKPDAAAASDVVTDFLASSRPRLIKGPWTAGWSLGFHSSFSGDKWNRSGVGDLAYRLKYRSDRSAIEPLVDEAVKLISLHPEMAEFDEIVPMCPSVERVFDPVGAFADGLGRRLSKPVVDALERTRKVNPQKEIKTIAEKRHNVAESFRVKRRRDGMRLLLVDDLYDSGATLEEACRTLRAAGADSIRVLTITRTIHTDR